MIQPYRRNHRESLVVVGTHVFGISPLKVLRDAYPVYLFFSAILLCWFAVTFCDYQA